MKKKSFSSEFKQKNNDYELEEMLSTRCFHKALLLFNFVPTGIDIKECAIQILI